MTITTVPVERIPAIDRREAADLILTENQRMVDLVRSLDGDDWARPTDCTEWNVRALLGHVLGAMEANVSFIQFAHQFRMGRKVAGERPFIDGMTEVQVKERAQLNTTELVNRITTAAPKAARARHRLPPPMRRIPMKVEVAGAMETWRMGYLYDIIMTRDAWMHRVDIARATGRDMMLTPEHDGRLIADLVAEWARRHGRPFTLMLEGPVGGSFTQGDGGEHLTLDAVEFCRTLSGRATGEGLLTTEVPF